MNQIIIDNNINWDYEGITGSQGKSLRQESSHSILLCSKGEKSRKLKQVAITSIYLNFMYQEGKKNLFKKKKNTQMHMYGEVLVKHLFKKGDISELPICYLPPMNQIIIDNNINWDYEGIAGSQGKPQTRVLTQHLIMFQRRKVQEAQTGCYYFNLF